jgi:hypothetical protein
MTTLYSFFNSSRSFRVRIALVQRSAGLRSPEPDAKTPPPDLAPSLRSISKRKWRYIARVMDRPSDRL